MRMKACDRGHPGFIEKGNVALSFTAGARMRCEQSTIAVFKNDPAQFDASLERLDLQRLQFLARERLDFCMWHGDYKIFRTASVKSPAQHQHRPDDCTDGENEGC